MCPSNCSEEYEQGNPLRSREPAPIARLSFVLVSCRAAVVSSDASRCSPLSPPSPFSPAPTSPRVHCSTRSSLPRSFEPRCSRHRSTADTRKSAEHRTRTPFSLACSLSRPTRSSERRISCDSPPFPLASAQSILSALSLLLLSLRASDDDREWIALCHPCSTCLPPL